MCILIFKLIILLILVKFILDRDTNPSNIFSDLFSFRYNARFLYIFVALIEYLPNTENIRIPIATSKKFGDEVVYLHNY